MQTHGSRNAVKAAAYAEAERLCGPIGTGSSVPDDELIAILSHAAAAAWLRGLRTEAAPMLATVLTHHRETGEIAAPDPEASSHDREFPDFPIPRLDPTVWRDASWANEACPRFIDDAKGLSIFLDHPDPARRELGTSPRFSLGVMTASPAGWQHDDAVYELAASDDLHEVVTVAGAFNRDPRMTTAIAATMDIKPWSLGGGIEGWGIRAGRFAFTIGTESGLADDDAFAPIWGVDWSDEEEGGPLAVERNGELTFRQAARAARLAADEVVAGSFDAKDFKNEPAKW